MAQDEAPRREVALALAALGALILAVGITPITSNDLFLHLRTGEVVLSDGSIPRIDDYSALARGRPFVAHEWLAGAAFRLIERAFGERGLDALIGFKVLVGFAVAGILYATARSLGAAPLIAIPALGFVMVLAAARFMVRPHIFGFLLTATYLLVLARRRAGRPRVILALVPLQVFWANLHGSFLLGPAIVGLAGIAALLDRFTQARLGTPAADPPAPASGSYLDAGRLIALALLLVLASLINPFGVGLLRYPFELTSSAFMTQIYEWLPPFGSPFTDTTMFRDYLAWSITGLGILTATGWMAMRNRRVPSTGWFPYLLFLAMFALSLRMNRNVTDFALATLPGVAAAASWIATRRGWITARRTPYVVVAIVLIIGSGWFVTRGYAYNEASRRPFGVGLGWRVPVGAADYLELNQVRGASFNTYDAGAYLIYRLYPQLRVGMDSRNGVYGESLFAAYEEALVSPEGLRRMLERLDAVVIVLDWPDPGIVRTAEAIRQLGGWVPVYFDDATVIYLQESGPRADLVERDRYRRLDPALFRPGTLLPEEAENTLAEADRAVRDGAGYVGRVMRFEALLAAGRRREALAEEGAILAERPRLHHIYAYLGLVHLAHGDRPAAIDRFHRALAINPGSPGAVYGMELAAGAAGEPE